MKTDRELLELAARAVGIVGKWTDHFDGDFYSEYNGMQGIAVYPERDNSYVWNPLQDDGDALRLAVKLNFRIDILPWGSECASWNAKSGDAEPKGEDHFAATRRAITRAAAQMQLNKEQNT